MSGLLWSSTKHPIGVSSILLKLCCPYMYVYADIVGAMFIDLRIFCVASACGNSQPHKCRGNILSTLARIGWKWSLNVSSAFSAIFYRVCMVGCFCVLCYFIILHWETHLILHHWGCVFAFALSYSAIIAWACCMLYTFPLMFGFSWVPQGLGSHFIHTLQWCISCRNFPVWSVYIIFFMSMMLMHISLVLDCGAWTICLLLFLSFLWLPAFVAVCVLFVFCLIPESILQLLLLSTWAMWKKFYIYCFEPCCFCGESCHCMVIPYYLLHAWEFVHVVDCVICSQLLCPIICGLFAWFFYLIHWE